MKRRNFIKNTAMTTTALATGLTATAANDAPKDNTFSLNYAPHLGMFQKHGGDGPLGQFKFMEKKGFRAFEDNDFKKRSKDTQIEMAKTMKRLNIQMGVFVAHTIYWDQPNLTSGREDWQIEFLSDIRSSIEVAKRVNAKWMTVVPGALDPKLNIGYQTANVIATLRKAAQILERHEIVMVIEPLNSFDHPNMFLTRADQAYMICKAVNSPSCKILFDVYHQQITEGNIIPNIEQCWDEIAYFQVGDNPGRKEPGTGEINFFNIFKYIREKGYTGIVGMEHGNSKEGRAGEIAVIDAYQNSDRT